tara:strand:- start:675 stop:824 length:150 start_codon:yes stop_codon:yes gene_type:complete
MSTSDQEQKSINVPQHKRLAMGEKLDGTSMQPKGQSAPKQGALQQAKKK